MVDEKNHMDLIDFVEESDSDDVKNDSKRVKNEGARREGRLRTPGNYTKADLREKRN